MNKKNLANGELLNAVNSSVTTFDLKAGQGSNMADVPFFATVTPKGELSTLDNSEIVQVTAVSGDELSVVRGQRGTTAKSFDADAIIANGVYVEDIDAKVDKVAGKGLSTNDYTTAEKNKLAGIEAGADVTDSANVQASLPSGTNGQVLKSNGTSWVAGTDNNTTYSEISEAEITTGTASTSRTISGRRAQAIVNKARTGVVKSTTTETLTVADTAPGSPANGDVFIDTSENAVDVISEAVWDDRVIDEDNMVSNDDTKWPTQQSVKAYVDDTTRYQLPDSNGWTASLRADGRREWHQQWSNLNSGTLSPNGAVHMVNTVGMPAGVAPADVFMSWSAGRRTGGGGELSYYVSGFRDTDTSTSATWNLSVRNNGPTNASVSDGYYFMTLVEKLPAS